MESSSSASSAPATRPLTVLSFDDGGLRGLSALFVLKKFITHMRRCALFHKAPEEVPAVLRPCDFFDVIGGTSTGGSVAVCVCLQEAPISELPLDRTKQLTWTSIFAVMFGSLGMNVDQAIDCYTRHFMFKKRRNSISGRSRGSWLCDPDAFELQIKDILEEGRRLATGESRARCATAVKKCQALVVATNETNGKPFVFSDFNDKKDFSTAKLTLACHATCAVPSLLPPAKGSKKDGASDAVYLAAQNDLMNPTSVLLSEIGRLYPGRSIGIVVSIGCGAPPSKSLGKADNLLQSVLGAMNSIYKATQRGTMMAAPLADPATNTAQHSYFRWTVGESLAEVGMFDVGESQRVKQLSEAYCQANNGAIESCVGKVERCSSHEWSDKDPFHENWDELVHAALRFESLAVERLLTRNEKLYSKASFRVAQIYAGILIKCLLG